MLRFVVAPAGRAFLCLAMLGVAACGGGGGGGSSGAASGNAPPASGPGTPPSASPAAPTEVGTPMGATVSASIGPMGGELASPDGSVVVSVPPGAFSSPQTVSLTPIQNKAHGAKGGAWRIEPHGVEALQPITLRFRVDNGELDGSALELLAIATQSADGRWQRLRNVQRDEASSTVSVQTTHFSDWAVIAGEQLRPARATITVGQSLDLKLVSCPVGATDGLRDQPLHACSETAIIAGEVQGWSVNGVPGGSSQLGGIERLTAPGTPVEGSGRARYTAPAAPPPGHTVAVSATYRPLLPDAPTYTLLSHVEVVERPTCDWLHAVHEIDFDIEMEYVFSASSGGASLSMDQRGRITGRMQRVFDNDLVGTWHGTTTQGLVSLNDSASEGIRTARLFGSGAPAIGSGVYSNDFSGAQLVVDYQRCTYSVTAKMAVVAGSGEVNDVPHATTAGSFTRGEANVIRVQQLSGEALMPPRPEADPVGTYAPGGLEGGRLFAEGFATPGNAGEARVRWQLTPR
ncbi:MAG: hypothetical protein REI94_14545 [Moraxellaceae bacterium]|nr:hypothetical protein [Moraxellaceae bacterium]